MSNGSTGFTGDSPANFDHAVHVAAEKAQRSHPPEELKEGVWYEVDTAWIKIGNPHITAYRVKITQGTPPDA